MAGSAPVDGLSLRAVTRRFGKRVAVDSVSFDVSRGEVLCILGPSGCGKTTTLRIAAGLERPDSGLVFIGGQLVEGDGRHEPPETRRVGLMFQDYALFPHLSALDNVAFGLSRLPSTERTTRAQAELARVGLQQLKNAYPHTLSGGEQQRVALARMLAPNPDVVLMDEPFSGLDAGLRDDVRGTTLKRLREARAATVMVTHDPDEATRVGDRVAIMREGRIVQIGTPGELYAKPKDRQAAALFGGANIFHARVKGGLVASPFGQTPASAVAEGEWAELIYRPAMISVSEHGLPARVVGVRPCAGQLEVEAAIEPAALPQGVEVPTSVRAMAPLTVELAPGTQIKLAARPEDALVFPCRDRICRA
ncbi:MAG TPA: ABC transporter ATP-binding protein [Micropepsaceae bacterium]|nr:ABC transporter ATP-binding protein [Micropepsaceae bacterium]